MRTVDWHIPGDLDLLAYFIKFDTQSWITQWAKGAAAQGPRSRGAPEAKTKKNSAHDDVKKYASKLVTTYPADIQESVVSEFLQFIALIREGGRHGDERSTYEWTVEGTWRNLAVHIP